MYLLGRLGRGETACKRSEGRQCKAVCRKRGTFQGALRSNQIHVIYGGTAYAAVRGVLAPTVHTFHSGRGAGSGVDIPATGAEGRATATGPLRFGNCLSARLAAKPRFDYENLTDTRETAQVNCLTAIRCLRSCRGSYRAAGLSCIAKRQRAHLRCERQASERWRRTPPSPRTCHCTPTLRRLVCSLPG